jgi:hypothetical protein
MEDKENKMEWLPGAITAFIIVGTFSLIMYFGIFRKEILEKEIEKHIVECAINGNKVAIYLCNHKSYYLCERKELIYEALNGNPHAIEAMGIRKKDLEAE